MVNIADSVGECLIEDNDADETCCLDVVTSSTSVIAGQLEINAESTDDLYSQPNNLYFTKLQLDTNATVDEIQETEQVTQVTIFNPLLPKGVSAAP